MVRTLEKMPGQSRSSPSQSWQHGSHRISLLSSSGELIISLEPNSPGWRSLLFFLCRRKAWLTGMYPYSNDYSPTQHLLLYSLYTAYPSFWTCYSYCNNDCAYFIEAIKVLHSTKIPKQASCHSSMLLNSPFKCSSQRPDRLFLASSTSSKSFFSPYRCVLPPNLLFYSPEPFPSRQCRPQTFLTHR